MRSLRKLCPWLALFTFWTALPTRRAAFATSIGRTSRENNDLRCTSPASRSI
jgi:hypothetical protein